MSFALQPAAEIPLRCGAHAVTLRASLRAAVALEALPGGIASLWDGVARQTLTALHAVIRAAATDKAEAESLLTHAAGVPLVQFLGHAQAACLALLSTVLDTAQGEASASTGPRIPLRQFLTDLFSLATSWLHWPPSEVWNASLAEIAAALDAQASRELRLAGITPETCADKTEQRQANIAAGLDPDFDLAAFDALQARLGV